MRKIGDYNLDKLSDSRIMYMRRPPKFTYIITLIVIIALVGVIIWSSYAIKAEQVQTAGIISTETKQIFSPEVSGTVYSVNFEEGDSVSSGDIILELDKSEINVKMDSLKTQKEKLEKRVENLDKIIDQVSRNYGFKQPFKNEGDEREFYAIFEKYLADRKTYNGDSDMLKVLRYQTEGELFSQRNACINDKINIENEMSSYDTILPKYNVISNNDGTIHFDTKISKGTVLQSGEQLGSIHNPSESKIIEMYISSTDRSKIEVGQECKFVVDGLAQTEYGSIKGKVSKISSDAILQDGTASFRVTVDFDADHVSDSNGGIVYLSNGMSVRAWVIYEKMTYMEYFFEKLGLKELFS